MRLRSFEVTGLIGQKLPIKLIFNSDLNIITGRNGSGKTSVLKLLWYIISGNISLALQEIAFKKATLTTDEYTCTVDKSNRAVTLKIRDEEERYSDHIDGDGDVVWSVDEQVDPKLSVIGSSVFLPTFRRIEGGFGLASNAIRIRKNEIEESLVMLSKRLTNSSHVFVAALSTSDVESILMRLHADLSEQYNKITTKTSKDIISQIKTFELNEAKGSELVLNSIKSKIEGDETRRLEIFKPIDAVKTLVMKIFRHSGIKIGRGFNFGDAAQAINSDALSAGEKQMLSFIAYNAVNRDTVILIDEPELSLHVDWQRQLFPILLGQQASNQFIIATHSPFIYSKYPDKEIQLDSDRGDTGNEAH